MIIILFVKQDMIKRSSLYMHRRLITVHGGEIWNSLPENIVSATSLNIFLKIKLIATCGKIGG